MMMANGGEYLATTSTWNGKERSPERWAKWKNSIAKVEKKVPVLYYISRNGSLEHPHFMEVPLSSNEGLYLRDVINRLNVLRGKGMASMYSWSSKRNYKNRFVWQDLTDNDIIYPSHGNEYILKGSTLLEASRISISQESASSCSGKSLEISNSDIGASFHVHRLKNPPRSSFDLTEHKAYKNEFISDIKVKAASDASTQTDDRRRISKSSRENRNQKIDINPRTELSLEEISPPLSSPETLECLVKSHARALNPSSIISQQVDLVDHSVNSGKIGASSVLMQLLSCGSISVKNNALSLMSHYKGRVSREKSTTLIENSNFLGGRVEDRAYFSGGLIDTKKTNRVGEFSVLQRSSSYNTDRGSSLDQSENIDCVPAKCIPMKPRVSFRKDGISHGSKINNEQQLMK